MILPIELAAFCGGMVAGAAALVALMWALVAWQRRRQ